MDFYIKKMVAPEYHAVVKKKISRQEIINNFQNGIFDTVLEYQTIEADGKRHWTACEIRTRQSKKHDDLIVYLIFKNIDEKKLEQMKLEKEATVDTLTGALKRQPACDRINQIIQKPLPGGCCHVFMILDMDNFKQLNDTLGHMSGDRALADFVAAADQALYKVKTSAKGCYCIAEQKK